LRQQSLLELKRTQAQAFAITETELSDIASAPTIGLRRMPHPGKGRRRRSGCRSRRVPVASLLSRSQGRRQDPSACDTGREGPRRGAQNGATPLCLPAIQLWIMAKPRIADGAETTVKAIAAGTGRIGFVRLQASGSLPAASHPTWTASSAGGCARFQRSVQSPS
jgi:hypothetical protein